MDIEQRKKELLRIPRMIQQIKDQDIVKEGSLLQVHADAVILSVEERDFLISELEKRNEEVGNLIKEVKRLAVLVKATSDVRTYGGENV